MSACYVSFFVETQMLNTCAGWRVHIGLAQYGHSGLSVWLEAIWYQPHKGRRLQTHSSHPPAWLRSKDQCCSARRMWSKFTWNVPHQSKSVTGIILLLLFSTKIKKYQKKKANEPTGDLWGEEIFRAAALVGWLVFFHCGTEQTHRKNCECCPGHYLSTSVY